jgi:hypothetical protein
MRRFPYFVGWLACLVFVCGPGPARAEAPPNPLRLVSDKADFFFKVEQPRRLVDIVYSLDAVKQLQKIDIIRELYDSTNYRRFIQLVAYFEKNLGMKYPQIIDQVAGGGIVVAGRLGNPPPAVLVIQGRDEAVTEKFAMLVLEVVGQELARQEAKERIEKASHRWIVTYRIGKDIHAAVTGSAILLSNKAEALHAAIDLYLDGDKASMVHVAEASEARKLLPPDPLAWGWLKFANIRKLPGADEIYKDKRDNFLLTVFFSAYLDLIRRSPYLYGGIYHQDNSLALTVRFPRGLDGMPPEMSIWHPPAGQVGSLPLLRPRNVLFSASYYWDLGKYWEHRHQLFTEKNAKSFEDFDKRSGLFLAGTRFSKLLTTAGPHHRLVAVQPTQPSYQTRPSQLYPAGAIVADMRDPEEFAKAMNTVLRAGALFASTQVDFKMTEEKRGDWTLVGYRFAEGGAKARGFLRNDTGNIRYNFSPCFARVGNQLFVSSTIELGRELVDLLDKEYRNKELKGQAAVNVMQFYGSGGAASMRAFKDQLLTQTILNQAASPEEADKQVKAFIDLVAGLGMVEIVEQYEKNGFHFDVRWKWGNGKDSGGLPKLKTEDQKSKIENR